MVIGFVVVRKKGKTAMKEVRERGRTGEKGGINLLEKNSPKVYSFEVSVGIT